jgi:hypothetical protein
MRGGVEVKKTALKAAMVEAWEVVRHMPDLLKHLSESLPRRWQDCVDVGGRQTIY